MNDGTKDMADEEADIERLLALAGPRLQPPEDMERRVRAATLAAFDALPPVVAPPRRSSIRARAWALAAGLLLVVGAGVLVMRLSLPAEPVAQIAYATGAYTVRGSGGDAERLLGGAIVQTSTGGRLELALDGRRSIRVDHGTSLTLHDANEIWLHQGRIYVDVLGGRPVTVVTPYASVTDVGTQFEVAVAGESLSIATREGRVDVQLGTDVLQASALHGRGELLTIHGLEVRSRTVLATTDPRWQWTQESRPRFGIGGRPVSAYLDWAARESGRVLRYSTPLAEQQAGLTPLGGRGAVQADEGSVARVLSTTSKFQLLDGAPFELVVGLREGP
jgi:ferric-dicitrate binding protein FerR (iron transport regulator)